MACAGSAERVVFASGAPVRSLGAALALIRHARLDAAAERLVLGGNARRLLGIRAADPMRSAAAMIDGAMGAE
jgi:predicted TIM-barrel fold metal-dependent hydrolase